MIYSVTFAAHDYGFDIHTETFLFSDYERARKRTEDYLANDIFEYKDDDEFVRADYEHAMELLNKSKEGEEFVYNHVEGSADFRVVLTPHDYI